MIPLCFQEYCRRGQEALKRMDRWEDFSSVDVHSYRVKLQGYRDQLEEFCTQLDENRHRICETVRLYEFFDKVRQGTCCAEEGVKSPVRPDAEFSCLTGVKHGVSSLLVQDL